MKPKIPSTTYYVLTLCTYYVLTLGGRDEAEDAEHGAAAVVDLDVTAARLGVHIHMHTYIHMLISTLRPRAWEYRHVQLQEAILVVHVERQGARLLRLRHTMCGSRHMCSYRAILVVHVQL